MMMQHIYLYWNSKKFPLSQKNSTITQKKPELFKYHLHCTYLYMHYLYQLFNNIIMFLLQFFVTK